MILDIFVWLVFVCGLFLVMWVIEDVLWFYFEFYEVCGYGYLVYMYDLLVVVVVMDLEFLMIWIVMVDVDLMGVMVIDWFGK